MKAVYVAACHQSSFGTLLDVSGPQIVERAVTCACREVGIEPAALDLGSFCGRLQLHLNEQGLRAGMMAGVPRLESKSGHEQRRVQYT
jgi:hypothetical protein